MSKAQFDAAYRAFCRRRPFRAFLIEFTSGHQIQVGQPESVRNEADLQVLRCPDGGYVIFDVDKVARLLDVPVVANK